MKPYQSLLLAALGVVALTASPAAAQKPETFEQAGAISTQTRRLILLEFYRDG